jgi:hypothetical protein
MGESLGPWRKAPSSVPGLGISEEIKFDRQSPFPWNEKMAFRRNFNEIATCETTPVFQCARGLAIGDSGEAEAILRNNQP